MTSQALFSALQLRRSRHDSASAFTLIELLAVIAIILILAALILSIAGNAQFKSAQSRATGEIKQMETGLESYKVDNGAYPRSTSGTLYTDVLNAQSATYTDPSATSSSTYYQGACEVLFQALSGTNFSGTSTSVSKAYVTFRPGQLSSGSVAPTSTTYIIDPFGYCYGYSTAAIAAAEASQAALATNPSSTPNPTMGFNPTFDLWSTSSYAPSGGKAYPSPPSPASNYWICNWK